MCRILRWAQVRHHDEAEVLTLAPGAIFQDRGFHQLSIESPCVRARIWSGHLGSGFRSGADEQIALHTHTRLALRGLRGFGEELASSE